MAAEDAVEELLLILEVAAQGIGHQIAVTPRGGRRRAHPVQMHETFGFGDGQRAQQDLIEQRKDAGVRTDSQSEREHGGGREAWAAHQHAASIPEVAIPVVEPAPSPDVAHFVLRLGNAAELQSRPPAGFGLTQAGPPQVFDPEVHVVPQLRVEILFHRAASPGERVEDPCHGAILRRLHQPSNK